MTVLIRLVVLWLLGACAPAADLNLVRGQECIIPGADGPLPLSLEECARYDERPQNFGTAPLAVSVIQCEGEGDLEGDETCKVIVECNEDPEHPLCLP